MYGNSITDEKERRLDFKLNTYILTLLEAIIIFKLKKGIIHLDWFDLTLGIYTWNTIELQNHRQYALINTIWQRETVYICTVCINWFSPIVPFSLEWQVQISKRIHKKWIITWRTFFIDLSFKFRILPFTSHRRCPA